MAIVSKGAKKSVKKSEIEWNVKGHEKILKAHVFTPRETPFTEFLASKELIEFDAKSIAVSENNPSSASAKMKKYKFSHYAVAEGEIIKILSEFESLEEAASNATVITTNGVITIDGVEYEGVILTSGKKTH